MQDFSVVSVHNSGQSNRLSPETQSSKITPEAEDIHTAGIKTKQDKISLNFNYWKLITCNWWLSTRPVAERESQPTLIRPTDRAQLNYTTAFCDTKYFQFLWFTYIYAYKVYVTFWRCLPDILQQDSYNILCQIEAKVNIEFLLIVITYSTSYLVYK